MDVLPEILEANFGALALQGLKEKRDLLRQNAVGEDRMHWIEPIRCRGLDDGA